MVSNCMISSDIAMDAFITNHWAVFPKLHSVTATN